MHRDVCGFDLSDCGPVMIGQDDEFRDEVLKFLETPDCLPPRLTLKGQTGLPRIARLTVRPGQISTQDNGLPG